MFLQLNPPSPLLQIPRIPSLSFKGFPDSRQGHQILSPICFLPEPLPKPTLRAWPSWVVPPRSSVRLRCQTPTKNVNFALRKGNILLDFSRSPASKEGLAEFHFTGLRTSHAGDYTCECYRPGAPDIRSPPSEVILLLVTGEEQDGPGGGTRGGDREGGDTQQQNDLVGLIQGSWGGGGTSFPQSRKRVTPGVCVPHSAGTPCGRTRVSGGLQASPCDLRAPLLFQEVSLNLPCKPTKGVW